ncbi:MAG: sigma-70 family RNA polymerase sigma factor [Anaerolineae bacterium]|nr:sigma-70 family RNA polymerase sigma factor [Anaerolineae bacterium]MDW8299790.1 sigma-70 family RNA polymerase sigma factor [Anaerolineae bacterium]
MDRQREQALIKAAQRGDQNAFATLYRAYVDKIYRYILFRVESAQTAEDLTAEVFLRMVESLPSYEDRSTPLLVWLYRVAHARVVDHYRRYKRTAEQTPLDSVEIRADPELDSALLTEYRTDQLRAALNRLTDAQRQVITLRFIEGYNLETTAQLMEKTVDAVKALQYRALQALAAALRAQGYQE